MAEEIHIPKGEKAQVYREILPQIASVIAAETNLIANLANVASILKMTFNHLWIGFYLVEGNTLVLGPFQGPLACTRIAKGKGVCGTVWQTEKTIIVKNVNEFEGHIACSSDSVSEIVVPLTSPEGEIWGVLDMDSVNEGEFDAIDQFYLEDLSELISGKA